jgi:hypothetical protein
LLSSWQLLAAALLIAGAQVTRAEDAKQLSQAQLQELDKLEESILHSAATGRPDQQTVTAGLSLAETRLRTQSGDPYRLLSALRPSVESDESASALRVKLARIYLLADLPWDTLSLLEPNADQLSQEGKKTLEKARLALAVIRQDAAAVAPSSSLYRDLSPLGSRLVDLLGIPPLVGSYSDFTPEMLKRKIEGDEDGANAALSDQAELEKVIEGPPLLTLMLGGAPPQGVQDELEARSTDLPPLALSGADTAALAHLVERARAAAPGTDIALLATEQAFVTRLAAPLGRNSDRGEPIILKRTAALRGSVVFLFDVGSGDFIEKGRALIAVDREGAAPQAVLFEIFNPPVSVHGIDVVLGQPQHIALSTVTGSDSHLDLEVFNPENGRLSRLANRAVHGEYNVLSLGDGSPPAIMVSQSTADRRFGDCNQCPARRLAWVVRYDRTTGDYITVAERRTGADLYARTNANLFGQSPEMLHHPNVAAALRRLSGRSPEYLKKKFKDDVGAIFELCLSGCLT